MDEWESVPLGCLSFYLFVLLSSSLHWLILVLFYAHFAEWIILHLTNIFNESLFLGFLIEVLLYFILFFIYFFYFYITAKYLKFEFFKFQIIKKKSETLFSNFNRTVQSSAFEWPYFILSFKTTLFFKTFQT